MARSAEKRRVVLGITGSIAAYKSAEFARILVSRGYTVRAVMTASAQEFISATTLEAVTGNKVMTDFWESSERESIEHIELADWADAVIVAPATADLIAKCANGFADTPLLATILATKVPILLAPAMNVNMYDNPATKLNIETLKSRGVQIIDPDDGELACGWNGSGRLADPWEIFYETRRALTEGDLIGKKLLITTGPTREAIDPVRFFSNRSSGKMGIALATEAHRRGADVVLVHGPVDLKVPRGIKCEPVVTAEQMNDLVQGHFAQDEGKRPDVFIMASAVTDYRPKEVSEEKLKKSGKGMKLELEENPDILAALGSKRAGEKYPLLVGFAVETGEVEDLLNSVERKLSEKQVDIVVGNFAHEAFESDTTRVWIVGKDGKREEVMVSYKSRVANKILSAICRLF